ncbi:MAG: hypothetical protein DWI58_20030 [Chloroflexi bacterium]|nr:MAG: hypothetical protein DWI58_20030 [Chloroflexota bacterium]
MFALLLSLLTRFSFTQAVALVAATSVATVALAGSADVVSIVQTLTASVSDTTVEVDQKPALAVLASQVQIDPNYVMKSVTYRLADVPTPIAAIVFRIEAPEVVPSSIFVKATNPAGAYYPCTFEAAGPDLAVTCPTRAPALQVAEVNRLFVEIVGGS